MQEELELKARCKTGGMFAAAFATVVMIAMPVQAHHSFAMYDLKITKVFTGVVTRVDPAPNHLSIFFAPMNAERTNVERDADGKPIGWTVEMGGSAQMARQGISVNSLPRGTIFSVGLHPLRTGTNAGSRVGGLFKCPEKKPPAPGKHCDSVEGNTVSGKEPLAEPTE